MKHQKAEREAQLLMDEVRQILSDAVAHATRTLRRLDRLLDRCHDEEERFARTQRLHKLDPLRGDYQHRPNGKHPVPCRWRKLDDRAQITTACNQVDRRVKRRDKEQW